MRNDLAQKIFEEIRDRPFRTALYPEKANNCYFKSSELIQKLTDLGFSMRGRLGEVDWADTPCPPEILKLLPEDAVETHFFPEIRVDGEWKILDPTWNKSFAVKFNLPYSEFNRENESCFKIHRLYDLEEQAAYVWTFLNDQQAADIYIKKARPFLSAINEWLDIENP